MTHSNEDATGPAHPDHGPDRRDERPLYEALGGLLLRVITHRYEVPPEDAASVLDEAFLAYYAMQTPPRDARAWLIAAVCALGKAYRERQGGLRGEGGGARGEGHGIEDDVRAVRDLVWYREALATLPRIAREALRLRVAEGKSYEEIAAILDLSADAAQRMVAKAAAKVRGWRREGR